MSGNVREFKALKCREETGMNSRQAINLLKGLEQSLDDYCELNDEGKAAFRMAITALELFGNSEQLPSIQPDTTTHDSIPAETGKNDGDRTSGDCISRQVVAKFLDDWLFCLDENCHKQSASDLKMIIKDFKNLPSAQPDIIRCKDCKWYGRADKRRFYRGMDCLQKRIDTIVPDRDFCSKAERRTKKC